MFLKTPFIHPNQQQQPPPQRGGGMPPQQPMMPQPWEQPMMPQPFGPPGHHQVGAPGQAGAAIPQGMFNPFNPGEVYRSGGMPLGSPLLTMPPEWLQQFLARGGWGGPGGGGGEHQGMPGAPFGQQMY